MTDQINKTALDIDSEHHVKEENYGNGVAIHTDVFDISPEALGIDLPENPYYYRDPKFLGVVVAMALGYWSTIVGWSLPANSLLLIDKDIGPSKNITWVALSNTLGLSVSFLLVGRLSDIFGRRWFFIIGNCLALIGAIIGSTAPSINDLIAGNLFNGLAGAVQISFTVAIAELVPNRHRPLWIGGLLFSGGPVIGFGPIIAQVFGYDTAKSWRWNYYTAVIIAAIVVILLVICYHPPDFHMLHKNRTRWEQFKRQDFIGMCLFIAGLVLLLMGVSWGGGSYPWKSAHCIVTIVVGVLTLIAFGIYDHFFTGDKLMPMYLFTTPGYLAMVLTAMVASGVYYGMSILWPQQVAYLFGGTPVQQGFLDCVVGIGTVVGQGIGGLMIHYVKKTRYITIGSAISLTAFAAAMVSVGVGDRAKGIGIMLMTCFAFGIIETASLALAPLSCSPEDLGLALGTLGSIRSAGGSIAAAIYTTILSNKLASITPEKISAAALAAGLPKSSLPSLLASPSNTTGVIGITPKITAAVALATQQAAASSFQYVWYAVIAFGCLAICASAFTNKDYNKFLTDEVARKLQGTHAHTGEEKALEA